MADVFPERASGVGLKPIPPSFKFLCAASRQAILRRTAPIGSKDWRLVMVHMMEGSMAKRLEGHSKGLEMPIEQQMRTMLWEAVPPQMHDNRKSWLARAARTLGWGQRRTKALFYCEARVVTAEEWKTLNERLNAAKQQELNHTERTNEHRIYRGGMGKNMPLDPRENPSLPLAAPAGKARSS